MAWLNGKKEYNKYGNNSQGYLRALYGTISCRIILVNT